MRLARTLFAILAPLVCVAAADQFTFVDYRLSVGVAQGVTSYDTVDATGSAGPKVSLTVIYGELNLPGLEVLDLDTNGGWVVGGRLTASHATGKVRTTPAQKVAVNTLGLSVVPGLAHAKTPQLHFEFTPIIGGGLSTTQSLTGGDFPEVEGSFFNFGVEFGTYYLFTPRYQVGLVVGWEQTKSRINQHGYSFNIDSGGIEADLSFGVRF
jgi:hypothetical protein